MKQIISETITENIFREFYGTKVFIEKSAIPKEYGFVSKNETEFIGYPDFFKDCIDYAIVVEAKAVDHIKATKEVQFYMRNNSISKDIIGIAISGQTIETLSVSYFIKKYASNEIRQLQIDNMLLSLLNIEKVYKKSKLTEKITQDDLTKTLYSLNKQFHDENIVRDTERSLFFSGLMIALKDKTFRNGYKTISAPSEEEAQAARGNY